ncbi:TonB-dependent receptor [Bacteroides sp.]|uniref:TonB-dependent receptor n=1 Tax=Bacteroides sp. TaxID=29523 RepID=UPI0025C0A2CE|nr:TonB-dependent receptor [Bacteroides sp.]
MAFCITAKAEIQKVILSGSVKSTDKSPVDFATVYLKDTNFGCTTDERGEYSLNAPAGNYTLVVSAIGFETYEKSITIGSHNSKHRITLKPSVTELDEVVVVSNGVSRLKRSAFNAVAVDTKEMKNSTKSLSDALAKAPGMKLRESGGVGSDMQMMLDGFSGKHVKVFIDGVPQEGVGSSFGLNNIPVNFAERIEVYKGVVPVGFGSDAIGGVINIVTNKKKRNWFLDASYSYGSFNTHKSNIHFGRTLRNGFTYEINAFQNYSDNNYYIDGSIKDFETGNINAGISRVKRFNDTYHNEAVIGKIGVVDKGWADRLMLGFTYSNMYQDIQTGVRQNIVYGEKHRKGYSLMPSVEYRKRDLILKGLELTLTGNYNRNTTYNVDTAAYEYNWLGDKKLMNTRGEQSYQYSRADNDNWNSTLTLNYRIGKAHFITFNNVFNAFRRENTSLLTKEEQTDPIEKRTRKNISGLSYRLMMSERWNFSAFAKQYLQYVSGPQATDANNSDFVRTDRKVSSTGYGAAGTFFVIPSLQIKLSYEKAYRLPTIEEMFGDEDLEMGDVSIRPENSDNINLNISYNKTFGKHSVYVEGGLVYRDTKDYIQRNIADLSGGKMAATYINYGKVLTKGVNASVRYGFSNRLSIGGNFTRMDVRDNQEMAIGTNQPNLAYKERMPNIPYMFADSDINLYWHNLFEKGNTLTFTYDNQYLHSFSYYSQVIGSSSDYIVPNQFSHNISLSYSMKKGRYNISFECRNLTDEKLYDNFSLQKAGRAFYGKLRIYLFNE